MPSAVRGRKHVPPRDAAQPEVHELEGERQGKEAAFKTMAAKTPLARFGKPEEIAAQIAFLLSEDSAFMTGACLVSDGGYSL